MDKKVADEMLSKPLENPKSDKTPAAKLILWMYTIEPPFYAHVNNAARFYQKEKLDLLGPYAWALGMITSASNQDKSDEKLEYNKVNIDLGPFQ